MVFLIYYLTPLEIFFLPVFLFQTLHQVFIILKNTLVSVVLQKGELISTSSAKFSAGADGSLYVVSPGGEESGEYVCTATSAAGYAKRKVQLTVYGEGPWRNVFLRQAICAKTHICLPNTVTKGCIRIAPPSLYFLQKYILLPTNISSTYIPI